MANGFPCLAGERVFFVLAHAAREAGLLTPESLDRLITDAIRRRQAADRLLSIAERVAAAGGESLTAAEIEAEVSAERQNRRSRAGGS